MKLALYSDGGARGNPGPAACGYVIKEISDLGAEIILEKCGNYLGETTNNQAEYAGLIAGLDWVVTNRPGSSLEIFMDSLLVVNQIKGEFKVKNQELLSRYQEARLLLSKLGGYSIAYIPRAQNHLADELVNKTLDAQS